MISHGISGNFTENHGELMWSKKPSREEKERDESCESTSPGNYESAHAANTRLETPVGPVVAMVYTMHAYLVM